MRREARRRDRDEARRPLNMGAQRPTMMSTCMLQVTWVSPGGGTRATNRGNVSFALVYMGFAPLCVGVGVVEAVPPPPRKVCFCKHVWRDARHFSRLARYCSSRSAFSGLLTVRGVCVDEQTWT